MHVSKDELEPMIIGEYEGRKVDVARCAWRSSRCRRISRPTHPRSRACPGDRCQCDHWGYLFTGSFSVTYTDGTEEVVRAGEAYHLRPGHFVQTLEPVTMLEISPIAEHDRTMATLASNMGLVTS